MNLIVDTSVIIAVITNEKHKQDLITLSKGANLIAPASLHWEIGNAFSAMLKRKRVSIEQAISALAAYREIPIHFSEVDLAKLRLKPTRLKTGFLAELDAGFWILVAG